ncbi:MAG: hypothetical protein Fur005_28950 [Roseiflexaceae bacterium]
MTDTAMLRFIPMIAGSLIGLLLLWSGWQALQRRIPPAQRRYSSAQQQRIRQLTPSFVSYVRVALEGGDAPRILLERYTARPDPQRQPMQALVQAALDLQDSQRRPPFAAFQQITRPTGCAELRAIAEQLAHAEQSGTSPQAALAATEELLNDLLRDEFTRMIRRRTLYLIGIAAWSLMVGVLGNLLFVISRGGQLTIG